MASILNSTPTWAIMLVVTVLIFGADEFGTYLGRSRLFQRAGTGPSAVVQAATFTLVGLLLAFAFSLALARYDARRAAFVQEANAIGTTFLRSELLDARTAAALRSDLRAYVGVRIDFARADADAARRARDGVRSEEIQRHMWELTMTSARRDSRSTTIPLLISALNEMIDLSTTESAVLTAHIPEIVMIGLMLIALIAAAMMGFSFGHEAHRPIGPKLLYAVVFALAIGLIFDLDRPQRGFVRVNLEPMLTLQHDIEHHAMTP